MFDTRAGVSLYCDLIGPKLRFRQLTARISPVRGQSQLMEAIISGIRIQPPTLPDRRDCWQVRDRD
jgi:hypothetical protein